MSAPPPKRRGQRYRVTVEGTYDGRPENPLGVPSLEHRGVLRLADGGGFALPTEERGAVWERLSDPEPEWQPGEMVVDARNNAWRCDSDDMGAFWSGPGSAHRYPLDFPARPLRRLVPEDAS